MQPADLLISPRWILPIEPEGAVLEGYSVVVHAGRIVEIGPTPALCGRYQPVQHVVRETHVLLPGFIDAHTSAARSLLREAPPNSTGAPPLAAGLRALERRWASAEFVRAGTLHAIAGMLRAGITCFADTYLFPEEVARLAGELRIRIAVGLPLIEAANPWSSDAQDALDRAVALWDAHKADPWARLQFAPDPPGALQRETLERLRRIADQLDAPVAMRLHENAASIRAFESAHGERPLAWLASLGLLRTGFAALHANHLTPAEMDVLGRSGVAVVHCPTAGLRLASGTAAVAGLQSRGVCVALGSGAAMAGVVAPDVLAEARLAALLAASAPTPESAVPGASAVLRMATLDGAQALGLAGEIGSIVAGKAADLTCIDLRSVAPGIAARVPDALVFEACARDVSDVWIGGRPHLQDRELCQLDAARIADTARQWAARMGTGGQR